MKSRLNLSIEQNLLNQIKRYADSNQVSISELFEEYFKSVIHQKTLNNIIDLVERLPNHSISPSQNLKKGFYEDYNK